MSKVSVMDLDPVKHVFQVHGADASAGVVIRKQLRRAQVLEFFGRQPRPLFLSVSWSRLAPLQRTMGSFMRELGRDGYQDVTCVAA